MDKSTLLQRFTPVNVHWIHSRAAIALLFAGSSIAAPPVIDDQAVLGNMKATLEAAVGKDGIPSADEMGKQVKSRKHSLSSVPLPEPPVGPPGNRYETLCKSVYLVSSIYKCGKCEHWHSGSSATAWCIGTDGLMISNAHVFSGAKGGVMGVTDREGRCYPITELLGWDTASDVAVFRVDAKGLQALSLGTAADVGSAVTVISHPAGNHFAHTSGSVSRYVTKPLNKGNQKVTWMAITADYARGSSGGPVFNDAGEVVGMVSNTLSIYTGASKPVAANGNKGDLQMVIKHCVPSESIRALFGKAEVPATTKAEDRDTR